MKLCASMYLDLNKEDNNMTYTQTLKTLAQYDEATLKRAMQEVNSSNSAKAKAMQEIETYKQAREIIAKWFNK